MNRILDSSGMLLNCVPRVGGDEPGYLHREARPLDVFPAWAGMNRVRFLMTTAIQRVPRVGGDEPGNNSIPTSESECSPRGRG